MGETKRCRISLVAIGASHLDVMACMVGVGQMADTQSEAPRFRPAKSTEETQDSGILFKLFLTAP
jgi:hypothetical protein